MTRTARILLAASFLALFPLGLLGPIYAIFVKDIGGDVLEAGASFAIFSILSGIFIFLLGRWKFFQKHLNTFVVIGY
jgi:MFS family permease